MKMSNYCNLIRLILSTVLICSYLFVHGQESPPDRPVRNMFEGIWIGDNQTVIVPFKGTLEFDIQHRFGAWDKGYDDFWGLFSDANFRIGFNYVFIENLQVGLGFTKEKLLWDFHGKYAIMRQTRSGAKPLSMTYLSNIAVDTRDIEKTNYDKFGDRLAYFHQLMMARKFSDKLSLQVMANFTHYNVVKASRNDANELVNEMSNDHFSASLLGKYSLKEGTSLIAGVDIPITNHSVTNPNANINIGFEFATSAHQFQLFIGNYRSIVPQYNQFFNSNDFGDNEILLGFNMTRLWSY